MFLPKESVFFNYRSVFTIYCLLFLGLTMPFWLAGEVVAPHRQSIEVGEAQSQERESGKLENRKFNDFTHFYIPEISRNLEGPRSGWLTLWTNSNEFGRPTYQLTGFSAAYPPSWLLAKFTKNPWSFITVLSLSTCFLTGVFVMLFCRERELNPLAALIAGTSLAASPFFMYWLTFPMFIAVFCWSAGALWGVTRLSTRPELLGWSVLAFSVFSLLIVARKQTVVTHAYILTAFGLSLAYRKFLQDRAEAFRFLALSITAVAVAVFLALPVYLDLFHMAKESARVAPPHSFFTAVLPEFNSIADVLQFAVLASVPELLGTPIDAAYPYPYNGISCTLLVIFFAIIGLLVPYKKTWGWWLAIAVLCLFAFIHPLYVLAVKFLGFNLSRSNPLGSIFLPVTVIVAYGADALIERYDTGKIFHTVVAAFIGIMVLMGVGIVFGMKQDIDIRWNAVAIMFVLGILLVLQCKKKHPALLLAALVMSIILSYPSMLRQEYDRILTSSALVDKVKASLPADSRFALAAPGLPVLPPNLNAGIGLASVHSYNSLSSRRYHRMIEALGGKLHTHGRWNTSISPDYEDAMFWMGNIGLVLSPIKIVSDNLEYLGKESAVHIHRVISRMGKSLQVVIPLENKNMDNIEITDPRALLKNSPTVSVDQGDLLEFEVLPMESSVFILSQKFHQYWQAAAFTQSGWKPAKTVEINGVFQGVVLPSDASRVRLTFVPHVRRAWIGHVFWLILLLLLGVRTWQGRKNFAYNRIELT